MPLACLVGAESVMTEEVAAEDYPSGRCSS